MKKLFFITCMLFMHYAFSQADSLQKQINEEVWKPFINAFETYDTDAFMSVHSRDVTRVIQDAKKVQNYDQYQSDNRRSDTRGKESNRKRTIELRFIQRIAADGRAFEVGYFKGSSINPDGAIRSYYGKFHVLLRKESGKWKILMDADAASKTDEAGFNAASPLE
jgi:ketosteroid isomerase-like protein